MKQSKLQSAIQFGSQIFAVVAMSSALSLSAWAEKHEIQSMNEVLPYVNAQTLVIFDIDNTLAEGAQDIGTVQWQEYEVEKAKAAGLNPAQALERSIRKFIAVNMVSNMRPVEQKTAQVVRDLQSRSVAVMALTARPAELHTRTQRLLKDIGIDLSRKAPLASAFQGVDKDAYQYGNGILAVSPLNDKGQMLRMIMAKPAFKRFTRVVFVDDKQKYVDSIELALEGVGVEHHSFRYGAADERVKNFNREWADEQTAHFEEHGTIIEE